MTAESWDRAVVTLRGGGVVGVPTDTVYGLAADPTDSSAVQRLFVLKGRPSGKPIALLVPSIEAASKLVEVGDSARELADAHWPGALTLILPTVRSLPEWVGDRGRTVGVRMPAHDDLLRLLGVVGPLAVTSANRAGAAPALDDTEAKAVFGKGVSLYLPGRCPGGRASTVVDLTGPEPQVLRQGPVLL